MADFTVLLEGLSISTGELVLMGDFNFYVENHENDQHAQQLLSLIDAFGLIQHVRQPTHLHSHTRDLIISRFSEAIVHEVTVENPMISDHKSVIFKINMQRPTLPMKKIKYSIWKNFDLRKFKTDITNSELTLNMPVDVDSATSQYHTVSSKLLEKHAPLQERVIAMRAKAPWYNSEIHEAKQFRWKPEHKWLKTKLEIDYDLFKQQSMAVNSLILDSKKTFYNDNIDSCAGDQKELFKIIDKIMHNYEEPQLPSHNSLDELVNKIADFFVTKNFWNQKIGDKHFSIKLLDWWKNIFTRTIGRF